MDIFAVEFFFVWKVNLKKTSEKKIIEKYADLSY